MIWNIIRTCIAFLGLMLFMAAAITWNERISMTLLALGLAFIGGAIII